jgi:hypothetical protein
LLDVVPTVYSGMQIFFYVLLCTTLLRFGSKPSALCYSSS